MDMDLEKMKDLFDRLSQNEREKLIENLSRITFDFKINKSFLNYSAHPLTIPKEFYSFLSIHGIINKQDLTVIFPDGSTTSGYIQCSNAGWGEYHQIKIRSPYSGAGISSFKVGETIKVEIFKAGENTHIEFRRSDRAAQNPA